MFTKIVLILLWQTAVATVQKGIEKWDILPCLRLDFSPFNKEEDEEWAPWCCLSTAVYRNSPSYASLVTSKTFMLYTWYSLVCMLNFSVALVLRIIWIKIVLKIMLVKAKVFPFFFFKFQEELHMKKLEFLFEARDTLYFTTSQQPW